MHRKKKKHYFRRLLMVPLLLATLFVSSASFSSQTVSYDFDTAGQLTSEFDGYTSLGSVSQMTTGGINNSGAIGPGDGVATTNAVFASKDTYSLGDEGSVYTFTTYLKSVGNSGYSGMGFSSLTPSAANASGTPFRPTDALGASVHGGGFVFHNGATDYSGSWNADNSGMTSVKKSSINDLLNSGSDDDWYFVKLVITRLAGNEFKMRLEVWPSDDEGNLLRPAAADAIFEISNLTNATLISAPSIKSYVNFSGYRVTHFDNYEVTLVGSTVIEAGSPVVLTSSATDVDAAVSIVGSVSSDGGAAISERGFVYSTSSDPTIADSKVVVSGTTGSMTGTTPSLTTGTYYFRAFATNANGTSYGENKSVSVVGTAASSEETADSVPTPVLPRIDRYIIQDGSGIARLAIEGKRLHCISNLNVDGIDLEFTTGFSTPWYEYLHADISSITPGKKTLVVQSCMGEVTYTNWLTIKSPVEPKSMWAKVSSFGLDEATKAKIAAFNSNLGDGYTKIRCIVNSSNGDDMNEALAAQVCSFAKSNDVWNATGVTETKDSFAGRGYWINIWVSGN